MRAPEHFSEEVHKERKKRTQRTQSTSSEPDQFRFASPCVSLWLLLTSSGRHARHARTKSRVHLLERDAFRFGKEPPDDDELQQHHRCEERERQCLRMLRDDGEREREDGAHRPMR